MDRIQQAFASQDCDGDGNLELQELRPALEALGLEVRIDDLWDMLATLEKMKGESKRPFSRINLKEFTCVASMKMLRKSVSFGKPRQPEEPSSEDVMAQVSRVLESANQRAQSYSEYFLQLLQSEVSTKVEALVVKLQDENARTLKQLSSAVLPKEAAERVTETLAPPATNNVKPPESEPAELQPAELHWHLPGTVPLEMTTSEAISELATDSDGQNVSPTLSRMESYRERGKAKYLHDHLARVKVKGALREKVMEADDQIVKTADPVPDPDKPAKLQTLQEESDAKRQLFADPAQLKDAVRTALIKNKYNVKDLYKDHGIPQKIARHSAFEMATMLVVIANSIWIWVDADLNKEPVLARALPIFQVAENCFCVFFVFEWLVRFLSFKHKLDSLQDGWFCFDSLLVCLTVVDTWVLTIIYLLSAATNSDTTGGLGVDASVLKLCRMMRLTRMCRMARLLRYMPELLIILRGLWIASKSVFFTLILLLFVIFVFGITFRQLTENTPVGARYFSSVHDSMISLFLHGTLPDMAEMVFTLGAQHLGLGLLLVFFILIATLTIMNMLVGVLVESVATVSTIENETLMVNMVRAKMLQMIDVLQLDLDGNGSLSKAEFEELLVLPEAAQFMQEVGVDVVGLVEYSDFIFRDREMSFSDFVELILQLRGTNQATVKDIVDLRKQVMNEFESVQRTVMEKLQLVTDFVEAILESEKAREIKDEASKKQMEKMMKLGKQKRRYFQPTYIPSDLGGDGTEENKEQREQKEQAFALSWNRLAQYEV